MLPLSTIEEKKIERLERWIVLLTFFALTFILFGSKLWVIHTFGNATPFWDQWDAEALRLYRPYLNGELNWPLLLESHNEHRIFLPRLLCLVLLEANGGIWNPLLQMVVNAALHVGTVITIILLCLKVTGRRILRPFIALSLFLFVIPYGWENTLIGISSHTSLVLLFSVLGIWFLSQNEGFRAKWWLGLFFVLFGLLSFAPGILVLPTAAAVSSILYIFNIQRTLRQILATLLLLTLFLAVYLSFPTLVHQEQMMSTSLIQFYHGLNDVLGWPMPQNILGSFLRNGPAAAFIYWMYKQKPKPGDQRWFVFGMIIWSCVLALAIAKGRVTESMSPRYLDFVALSALTNFVCLLWLINNGKLTSLRWPIGVPIAWVLFIVLGLCSHIINHTEAGLSRKQAGSILQEQNIKEYLRTNDITALERVHPNYPAIPYPDPKRLAYIMSLPEIQKILPSNINATATEGRFDSAINVLLSYFHVFIFLGIGLGAVLALLVDLKTRLLQERAN